MLLRRITKHVRDQNWFAVALDFVIVVAGILIAFQITNWNAQRQNKADLAKAEIAIKPDLIRNYAFAKERLSLKDCRIAGLRELSDRLMESGDIWKGIADPNANETSDLAIAKLISSPKRPWGSHIWQAELARGSFNAMDTERRENFNIIFLASESAMGIQETIFQAMARLKTLTKTTELSRSDRLRYHDIVAVIDENTALLEAISKQIVHLIETGGIELNADERKINQERLDTTNANQKARHGDCYKAVEFPFLNDTKPEAR